jgi:DNA polymerase I-like protein with 3'-5' exonuclease and polymerase domains
VHDEVVCVVPEDKAEWTLSMMEEQMKRSPSWAKDLPISCEGGIGDSYGDAK